ncbi:MAG: hypothetical protein ACYTFY_04655 [Planctomycetota bacterium]|jgi:hypothetical protein
MGTMNDKERDEYLEILSRQLQNPLIINWKAVKKVVNEKKNFTYLEYLEFSSAEEFEKFRDTPPISDADIAEIDWDTLCGRLDKKSA